MNRTVYITNSGLRYGEFAAFVKVSSGYFCIEANGYYEEGEIYEFEYYEVDSTSYNMNQFSMGNLVLKILKAFDLEA